MLKFVVYKEMVHCFGVFLTKIIFRGTRSKHRNDFG